MGERAISTRGVARSPAILSVIRQVRAVIALFVLFGAGCGTVSASPAAVATEVAVAKLPVFIEFCSDG